METRSRSWVATAGLAVACVGLLVEFLSGFGYRHGWWGLRMALRYLLRYGFFVAAGGVVLSLAGLLHARIAKLRGGMLGALGVVAGLVPALMVFHQYRLARSVPPINDIATDVVNPPGYVTAATNEFWKDKDKDISFPAKWADTVRQAYPDLAPLVLPLPAGKAFAAVQQTAAEMSGWVITGVDAAAGRIEATATTRWFGFKDDVVIRVAPRGADSAVVDMRSKSRVGRSDVGANAARIRTYWAALRKAAARQ